MSRNIILKEEKEDKIIELDNLKRVYIRENGQLNDCFISKAVYDKITKNKKMGILDAVKNLSIYEIIEALDETLVHDNNKIIIEKIYDYKFPLGVLKVLSFSKHSFTFNDIYFPGFIEIVKDKEAINKKRVYLAIYKDFKLFFNINNEYYEAYLDNVLKIKEISLKRLILKCHSFKENKLNEENIEIETLNVNPKPLHNYIKDYMGDLLHNFDIELNDSKKLIVEHLPKIDLNSSIVEIPETVTTEFILNPNTNIDLGNIEFKVKDVNSKKVLLEVIKTSKIIKEDESRMKKGEVLELDYKNKYSFSLKDNFYQETWDLSLAKSTFDKELRYVDFHRIINSINELDYVKDYTEIERLETDKSIILFLYLVMQNNDYESLNKLYKIIKDKKALYEEYITKYNIEKAMLEKDMLDSFEAKKRFLEKSRFTTSLADANFLTYPRYIFESMNYFLRDDIMKSFKEEKSFRLEKDAFKKYLYKLFEEHDYYENLNDIDKNSLEKALDRLSIIYKNDLSYGEDIKYEIEEALFQEVLEEDLSLLISNILLHNIKDKTSYLNLEEKIKSLYLKGQLKIPYYTEKEERGFYE